MGQLVNLRRARKGKARDAAEATAAANRNVHGIPKRERVAAKAEKDREQHRLREQRLDSKNSD